MNKNAASHISDFDGHYAAQQLRRSRDPLRRFVKGFYLRNLLKDLHGPTIDFGCGAGQLLKRLPAGSVGLEVNLHLIEVLRAQGLAVHRARADLHDFELLPFAAGTFDSLVIAHVLEHIPAAAETLRTLLAACCRIGITTVTVVVPGAKGFTCDHTHKTFIDRAWVQDHIPAQAEGFTRSQPRYFPGPWAWVGRYFTFHEMKIVFTRTPERA